VDLEKNAIHLEEDFTAERFYQEISVQVLNKRMGEGQFQAHIEDTYGSKKTAFFLIDEMQCAIESSHVEWAVRRLCRFLDKNGIPRIGVGTSELRELVWKKTGFKLLDVGPQRLGSPFNRA
jgi:hypothetical protein